MSLKFLLRRAAAVAACCELLLLPRFTCGQTRGPGVDARATQVLEAADDAQEAIERIQSGIDRSLDEYFRQLDGAIALVNDEDFFGEQMTFATLRAITPRLRRMAGDAITAHERLQEQTTSLETALREGLPAIRQAGLQFRDFAEEEQFAEIAKSYRHIGDTLLATAVKYDRVGRQLEPSTAAVASNLRYVQRTDLFLARLETVLDLVTDDVPELDAFIENLTKYARSFEQLQGSLKRFHAATRGELPVADQVESGDDSVHAAVDPEDRTAGRGDLREPEAAARNRSQATRRAAGTASGFLTGEWQVRGAGTRLYLKQSGDRVELSLVRSSAFDSVDGQFRLVGDQLRVSRRLVYRLKSGHTYVANGAAWQVVNTRTLAFTDTKQQTVYVDRRSSSRLFADR